MATPITWQNVSQPDVSTAWRGLSSAQQSLNGAFDGLGGIIAKGEAVQAQNDVAIKNNNTQDYLNKVAELGKTPEALQAAIATGAIDKLKASYGTAIDQVATRGAAEGLLDQRFKQAQTATDFNNSMLNEKTAPIMDKFKVAVQSGNTEAMEKYRSEYTAAGGKHAADLEGFLRTNTHENQTWDEQKKGWVRDQGKYEADLKHMSNQDKIAQGQLAVSQGSLDNARENTRLSARQLDMTMQDRLDKRKNDAIDVLGKARSSEAGSAEGQAAIFAGIASSIKDPGSQVNARRTVGEILKKNPNASSGDVMSAVLTMDDNRWWYPNASERSTAIDRAMELAGSSGSKARADSASLARDAALENYGNAKNAAANGPLAVPLTRGRSVPNPVAQPAGPAPLTADTYAASLLSRKVADATAATGPVQYPTGPSALLGGPRAPVDVEGVIPGVSNDPSSGINKFLRSATKLDQAAAASKIAADSTLKAKVANANTAKQVEALLKAAKAVKPESEASFGGS